MPSFSLYTSDPISLQAVFEVERGKVANMGTKFRLPLKLDLVENLDISTVVISMHLAYLSMR